MVLDAVYVGYGILLCLLLKEVQVLEAKIQTYNIHISFKEMLRRFLILDIPS
jgi:hypothetical protein